MAELTKTCKQCGSTFIKGSTVSKSDWLTMQCCSKSCAAIYRGSPWLEKHKLQKGHGIGIETRFTKGSTLSSANVNWKGDEASYAAIHMWVKYHYGKPQECEKCGTTEKRMYHWANISGRYTRERSDWMRLCVPCHKRHDLAKKG